MVYMTSIHCMNLTSMTEIDLKWDQIYMLIISTNFELTRAARTLHCN